MAAACSIVAFETGGGDDAGQQVIAAEQDAGSWVPQRQVTCGVPGADHTHELTTAGGQEVPIPDTHNGARICPSDQPLQRGVCGGG